MWLLSLLITPFTALFGFLKGMWNLKIANKVVDAAVPIVKEGVKAIGDSARYTAIGQIETAVQQYGPTFAKDGRTVVALIAISMVILFIFGWLPRAAFGPMPPIIMELCKWVEYYMGLTVTSSTAIAALNTWASYKRDKQLADHRHELEVIDRNRNGIPDNEEDNSEESK